MLKLLSLHHVQVQVPDLEANSRFARSFGLIELNKSNGRTYWRTSGRDAYSYVAEQGPTLRLLALAFLAESRVELEKAVREHGATPVRKLDGPAGGEEVTLTDPEGNTVRIVHGIQERQPDPLLAPLRVNTPGHQQRFNEAQVARRMGPSQLLRLGHAVLNVRSFATASQWYQEVLGFVPSDRFFAGPPGNFIGGFFRLDRGSEWVDHHTLGFFQGPVTALHHISFEVQDYEQQMAAHRHLLKEGWKLVWGVGRHALGSHVFDTWKEPNGIRFETFSDTDLCNRERSTADHPIDKSELDIWRDQGPEAYFA